MNLLFGTYHLIVVPIVVYAIWRRVILAVTAIVVTIVDAVVAMEQKKNRVTGLKISKFNF